VVTQITSPNNPMRFNIFSIFPLMFFIIIKRMNTDTK
jgi:hypothetical protein